MNWKLVACSRSELSPVTVQEKCRSNSQGNTGVTNGRKISNESKSGDKMNSLTKNDTAQLADLSLNFCASETQESSIFSESGSTAREMSGSSQTPKPTKRCVSVADTSSLESVHVQGVYDQIAPHIQDLKLRTWPRVRDFLDSLTPGSLVADVGCGNGRYLHINPSLLCFGMDTCQTFLQTASTKGFEVLAADNLSLPFRDQTFDAVLSVGVIHHFSSLERRVHAVQELVRILGRGGRMMIYVWAFEQKYRRFDGQDILVPWCKPRKSDTHQLQQWSSLTSDTDYNSAGSMGSSLSDDDSPCKCADERMILSGCAWEGNNTDSDTHLYRPLDDNHMLVKECQEVGSYLENLSRSPDTCRESERENAVHFSKSCCSTEAKPELTGTADIVQSGSHKKSLRQIGRQMNIEARETVTQNVGDSAKSEHFNFLEGFPSNNSTKLHQFSLGHHQDGYQGVENSFCPGNGISEIHSVQNLLHFPPVTQKDSVIDILQKGIRNIFSKSSLSFDQYSSPCFVPCTGQNLSHDKHFQIRQFPQSSLQAQASDTICSCHDCKTNITHAQNGGTEQKKTSKWHMHAGTPCSASKKHTLLPHEGHKPGPVHTDPEPPKKRTSRGESSSEASPDMERITTPANTDLCRFYHVFREGELADLINQYVPQVKIINSFYDHANWCLVLEKM